MKQPDFPTILARLLSDRELRAAFARDPRQFAREFNATEADTERLLALDAAALEAQAQTLLKKRFAEASQLIPVTFRNLGARANEIFFDYAEKFWPNTHQRHAEDAVAFCDYLTARDFAVCESELSAIRFSLSGRRFGVNLVRGYAHRGAFRSALLIFYLDRARRPRRFAFFFGI